MFRKGGRVLFVDCLLGCARVYYRRQTECCTAENALDGTRFRGNTIKVKYDPNLDKIESLLNDPTAAFLVPTLPSTSNNNDNTTTTTNISNMVSNTKNLSIFHDSSSKVDKRLDIKKPVAIHETSRSSGGGSLWANFIAPPTSSTQDSVSSQPSQPNVTEKPIPPSQKYKSQIPDLKISFINNETTTSAPSDEVTRETDRPTFQIPPSKRASASPFGNSNSTFTSKLFGSSSSLLSGPKKEEPETGRERSISLPRSFLNQKKAPEISRSTGTFDDLMDKDNTLQRPASVEPLLTVPYSLSNNQSGDFQFKARDPRRNSLPSNSNSITQNSSYQDQTDIHVDYGIYEDHRGENLTHESVPRDPRRRDKPINSTPTSPISPTVPMFSPLVIPEHSSYYDQEPLNESVSPSKSASRSRNDSNKFRFENNQTQIRSIKREISKNNSSSKSLPYKTVEQEETSSYPLKRTNVNAYGAPRNSIRPMIPRQVASYSNSYQPPNESQMRPPVRPSSKASSTAFQNASVTATSLASSRVSLKPTPLGVASLVSKKNDVHSDPYESQAKEYYIASITEKLESLWKKISDVTISIEPGLKKQLNISFFAPIVKHQKGGPVSYENKEIFKTKGPISPWQYFSASKYQTLHVHGIDIGKKVDEPVFSICKVEDAVVTATSSIHDGFCKIQMFKFRKDYESVYTEKKWDFGQESDYKFPALDRREIDTLVDKKQTPPSNLLYHRKSKVVVNYGNNSQLGMISNLSSDSLELSRLNIPNMIMAYDVAQDEQSIHILGSDASGNVLVWDSASFEKPLITTSINKCKLAAFNPVESNLIAGSTMNMVMIFDSKSNKVIKSIQDGMTTSAISWNERQDRTLTIARGNIIAFYDLRNMSKKVSGVKASRADFVNMIQWSKESKSFVSASKGGKVKLWQETRDGEWTNFEHGGHQDLHATACFGPKVANGEEEMICSVGYNLLSNSPEIHTWIPLPYDSDE